MEDKIAIFNDWFKDTFEIDEPVLFETNEEGWRASNFGLSFGQVAADNVCWISFNDEIKTSQLLIIAQLLVPYLNELFDNSFAIIECFALEYDKVGEATGVLYEHKYNKTFKPLKPPKAEKKPAKKK
jgi:hypothetical protein